MAVAAISAPSLNPPHAPPSALRPCLQVEPGVYDEAVFRGLDVVLAEAERAGLRVILSLADNWKRRGGIDEVRSGTPPPGCPARSQTLAARAGGIGGQLRCVTAPAQGLLTTPAVYSTATHPPWPGGPAVHGLEPDSAPPGRALPPGGRLLWRRLHRGAPPCLPLFPLC